MQNVIEQDRLYFFLEILINFKQMLNFVIKRLIIKFEI